LSVKWELGTNIEESEIVWQILVYIVHTESHFILLKIFDRENVDEWVDRYLSINHSLDAPECKNV